MWEWAWGWGIAIKKKERSHNIQGEAHAVIKCLDPPVEWEKGLQVVISQEKWKFCDKE